MTLAPKHPVPVFPLEGVVLFPHAALALHVFELRYRTMVRDALSGGRVLAIATLRPGWETAARAGARFHELGCLAKFEQVSWLDNDCYDLRVRGLVRARFTRIVREFPYDASEVEELPSAPYEPDDPLGRLEREALVDVTRRLLPLAHEAWLQPPISGFDEGLEPFVNAIAQAARIGVAEKLELLSLDSVFERARRLRELLAKLHRRPAPPGEGRN